LKSQIGSQLWKTIDVEVDIYRAWVSIGRNIKESLGYYELKKHKPWCDEGCSELLNQRKQDKLH
jgi:hypothetical protein